MSSMESAGAFGHHRPYAVAPDGRFLMGRMAGDDSTSSPGKRIVVVQDWVEEVRTRVPLS